MKKILLSLVVVALAFSANAQLILSANVGGGSSSSTVQTHTQISVVSNESSDVTAYPMATTSFTGGLKIGYKFGKAQAGISGSYSFSKYTHQPLDSSIVPMLSMQSRDWTSTGEMSSRVASFTVAPYFRYDLITAGDVSLFVELNLFYTKSMNPFIEEVKVNNTSVYGHEFPWDTNSVTVPRTSTSFGARVTPGLSWQLSKHCGIDLYLDFLSLAYSKTKSVRTDLRYSVDVDNMGQVHGYRYTAITHTEESSQYSGALTGTPLLTELGSHNWVRVGFNFTF